MEARAKSLNERLRTLISLFFGLAIGCALLFGESRWEMSPLIEESLMLLACFMAGIGAFGRIWCSLYIAGIKTTSWSLKARTPCAAIRFTSSASSAA